MKKYLSKLLNRALAAKIKFVSLSLMILALLAVTVGSQSCKAWRTITTTSTYTGSNDSTKTAVTIQTKTVEEYQGAKRK